MDDKELLEKTAEIFYVLGQQQAKSMGMTWSKDKYEDIAPDAKDFYRAFARYVIDRMSNLLNVIGFYADQRNWATVDERDGKTILRDGPVHDDQGEIARKMLLEIHGRNINSDEDNG